MTYLTSPEVVNATSTYRFIVELHSIQLDHEGIPVDYALLDILICDSTEQAIRDFLQSKGYTERKGWQLLDYWMPYPNAPF